VAAYESWRLEVAWSTHPDDPPVWVDETARVDGAVTVAEGRADHRADIQVSTMSVALRNHDQRYTPGNTQSPLYPDVRPARRCRALDTVAGEEITVFDGYIELPEITTWQKSSVAAPREQLFHLSAVDRMGRLDRARPFISTLAEHIRYVGGTRGLVAYWPMISASGPLGDVMGGRPLVTGRGAGGISRADEAGPRGDDASAVRFAPTVHDDGIPEPSFLTAPVSIPVGASQVVALSAWVRIDAPPTDPTPGSASRVPLWLSGVDGMTVRVEDDESLGIVLTVGNSPVFGQLLVGGHFPADVWRLVTAIMDLSADTMTLCVGADTPVSDAIGASPAAGLFDMIRVGGSEFTFESMFGSAMHLQVYVGAAGEVFDAADHLAQYRAGYDGLDRQRVDERMTTIANYAGIPADDLHLGRASAIMSRARLAGRRPGELLREAAEADNGHILAHGDGHIAFAPRHVRYRPALAATVELTWLSELAWRPEPPANVAEVSTTDGATGYAIDADSVAEYGEYAPDLPTLDTAVPDDASNLAAFTVRMARDPRQRPARMVFELGWMSDTQRRTILRREFGDMVRLDGLPANAPEGAELFHIEGMVHRISAFGHRVTWHNGPIYATVAGVPDPMPLVGAAQVSGTTIVPY
jgi:hypothetical protein